MKNAEEMIYIRDSFFYLVANGLCNVYRSGIDYDNLEGTHWCVGLNGRLYTEVLDSLINNNYLFRCKTDYGTVEVTIPRFKNT